MQIFNLLVKNSSSVLKQFALKSFRFNNYFVLSFQDLERLEAKMRTCKLSSPLKDQRLKLEDKYLNSVKQELPERLRQLKAQQI